MEQKRILVMGDSISAAYGMSLDEGWVALLQDRLHDESRPFEVINASITGETSAGASSRLPELLQQHSPDVVILELGGNDGLRGYPIKRFRENMAGMAQQSLDAGARVLLLGMEIPPNYGSRYTSAFRESFSALAEEMNLALVPFMLQGVATRPELMQRDGIHPTVAAQSQLLDNVWPTLQTLLEN